MGIDRTPARPPVDPQRVLMLPESMQREIIAHLMTGLPNEGVGLLAVEWEATASASVAFPRRFYPGTNIRQSRTRYQMDWAEVIAAHRDMEANGWTLGAIIHSHPAGPATPSETDLAEWWYPESLMVIASFAVSPPDLRAWSVTGDEGARKVREVPIRTPASCP